MIYESYNLPKNSPTVGLFFFAEDYICFLENLKEFVEAPLEFISPEDSKWKARRELVNDKRFGNYPIGQLSIGGGQLRCFSCIIIARQRHKKNGSVGASA